MANAVMDPTDPSSPLSVSSHETALLLMDYQNLLRGRIGIGAWASVTKIASQLRDWALEKNMAVFHCLIDTSRGTKPPVYMRTSTKWKAYEAALAATPGLGDEADVLAPRAQFSPEATVVRIPGFVSALESYGLAEALRARGVKSLILGGISTSGCVLSTARAATDRGFIVTVAEGEFSSRPPHTNQNAHLEPPFRLRNRIADTAFERLPDACFDPVPGLHGMLVAHVLPMSAHVATSREIRDAWKIL